MLGDRVGDRPARDQDAQRDQEEPQPPVDVALHARTLTGPGIHQPDSTNAAVSVATGVLYLPAIAIAGGDAYVLKVRTM